MVSWLFLAMELSWLCVLLSVLWLMTGAPPPVSPFVVVLAPLGIVTVRMSPAEWRFHRWYDLFRWGVAVGLSAGAVDLAVLQLHLPLFGSTWWMGLCMGVALFWRGWFIGEDEPDAAAVERAFETGCVLLVIGLGLYHLGSPDAGVIPAVCFFAIGLLGLGVARRIERHERGGPIGASWLGQVGILVALLLIGAVVVTSLVTPDLLTLMASQVQWLIASIGSAIAGLFSLIPGATWLTGGTSLDAPPSAAPPPPAPRPTGVFELPPWVFWLGARLADLLIVTILAFAAVRLIKMGARALRRVRLEDDKRDPSPSIRESVTWRGWLWDFLRRLFGWRKSAGQSGARTAAVDGSRPSTREQLGILELYGKFLLAARRAGLPRRVNETPAELGDRVGTERPRANEAVETLTSLFESVRYAQRAVGRGEVSTMRRAVERATETLQQDS
ncbi:MAG: DUF4129 domain-containing protein [Chloroflexota bacterium]